MIILSHIIIYHHNLQLLPYTSLELDDKYIKMKNTNCTHQYETSYATLEEAKSFCTADSKCIGIAKNTDGSRRKVIKVFLGLNFIKDNRFHLCQFSSEIEMIKDHNFFAKEMISGIFKALLLFKYDYEK